MTNTIWIVRRHPQAPYMHDVRYLAAFTIHMSTSNKAKAKAEAARKNASKNTPYLYTVGKVTAKESEE